MSSTVLEKVSILLVDDRPEGLLAMQAVLRRDDYNLVVAASGEEALRYFLREDFAVVLLDVQMPGIDGFETARLMHNAQNQGKTPIIFVTAINFEDRYVYAGYEAGAVDYLFKPFDPVILKSKVAFFVNMYRLQLEVQRQGELLRDAQQVEAERRLLETEIVGRRRYQYLADAVPHIVWRARPDGAIEYFNKMWFDYSGLSVEASLEKGWKSIVYAEDQQQLDEDFAKALLLNKPFESEIRLRRESDQTYRWHLVRGTPEYDGDNNIISWIGTNTDIHDRKLVEEERGRILRAEQHARHEAELSIARRRQAEQAIIRAKEDAEQANKAKTQLLANMSHEIRTPLGIVLGFAELLLDPNQSEEDRREGVETILRNGKQLSRLIDDILDISKAEAGRIEIETVSFNLKEMLNEMYGDLALPAQEKNLVFEMDISSDVPETVLSDPMRLMQILVNTVGNAIKFTDRGKIRLEVNVEQVPGDPEHWRLLFDIQDTGVGIASDKQKKLFQEFMQADTSTTRRFGGTGLGLALSRRLCRMLGGDLVLAGSEEGKGSTFHLWINIKPHEQKPPANVAGFPVMNLDRLDGIKVLLVDDSEDNQVLISHILTRLGGLVDVANDGFDAIEKCSRNSYDIVLMDIQMPRLDGYETVQLLRSKGCTWPVIALTAHTMKDERDRCVSMGFNDHICKPVNWSDLVHRVKLFTSVSSKESRINLQETEPSVSRPLML